MKIGSRQKALDNSKKTHFFLLALCAFLLAPCLSARGQAAGKVARVGLLSATTPSNVAARSEAFRQGLRELGYVEGDNIIVEYRYAHGKFDRLPALATELVNLKLDVIVTGGPAGANPLMQATSTIPIVIAQGNDPVGSGFVASLSHPGGNITGLSMLSPEISGKKLEILKETVPTIKRVALVGNATEPGNSQSLKEAQNAAAVFGIQLQYIELRANKDIETVFRSIKDQQAGALILLRNPIAGANRKRIMEAMAGNRIPGMYPNPNWVNAGGLMYYGANISDIWRRAAIYVHKILKGAKPADLPVEQPTTFEFIVNLKAARRIGLTMPPNVLARADKVVQ